MMSIIFIHFIFVNDYFSLLLRGLSSPAGSKRSEKHFFKFRQPALLFSLLSFVPIKNFLSSGYTA